MSKDFKAYATAKPTDTMVAFADWLLAEVYEGKLPKGMDEASFRAGVALGGSTRGYFQKSEAWKADPRNYLANVDARREAKVLAAAEKAKAAKTKSDERAAKAIAAAEAILAARDAKLATDADADADAEAEAA
jgi:hypothetical protein